MFPPRVGFLGITDQRKDRYGRYWPFWPSEILGKSEFIVYDF
jgi:hypothetical protein